MSRHHDLYGAYTDAELVSLWRDAEHYTTTSESLEAELRDRGYTTRDADGERAAIILGHSERAPHTAATPDAAPARYTVELSRTPDLDGDYRATILTGPGGEHVKTLYDRDRDELRRRVATCVEALRKPSLPDEVYEV